jgi:ubiquinone/menaquinone biosynthesis C-methylase UbiE
MADDLASGFQNVDKTGQFEVYSRCLTLLDSIPFFGEYKRESYGLLLIPSSGRRLLEVGCGLGDDASTLAKMIAPTGAVVGIDGSRGMIEAAQERHGGVEELSFAVANAAALPFDDASFDGCRIDRVLMHIGDPSAVIREMARVLRPGGTLVAFDNDWETLTVDSDDRKVTRIVLNAWCDRFPSGWIGRKIARLLEDAGLRDVRVFPKTLVIRDLAIADRLYCFFSTVKRLEDEAVLTSEEAQRWSDELRERDRAGRFFCSYTGFLVCARKAP